MLAESSMSCSLLGLSELGHMLYKYGEPIGM